VKVDVVAVSLEAAKRVLWSEGPYTEREAEAEAVIRMAIFRQGVADRFFTTSRPGRYKAGDAYF
jgi:hypothetical protein